MRVAIITSSYPRAPDDSTNAGVFVRDFACQLADRGHHIVVISPQPVEGPADHRLEVMTFRWPGAATSLSHLNPRNPLTLLRLALLVLAGIVKCIRVARERRVDHVLAMWAVPSGLLALAVRSTTGIPYSVWALGSDIWKIGDYPFGPFLLRRVLRAATKLYADGFGLADDVTELSGRPCQFLATSRQMPELAQVKPPPRDRGLANLLCVARWHPHKGVDVLLDAVCELSADVRSKLKLRIFGGGPDAKLISAKVREGLSDVVSLGGFVGRTELMAELLRADALIVPSRIESIPLILTDAAQARCPVVVTDVGDMARLVATYGIGQAVAAEDPRALADAISRVVEGTAGYDPAGAARMVEDLSLSRSVDEFLRATRTCHGKRAVHCS